MMYFDFIYDLNLDLSLKMIHDPEVRVFIWKLIQSTMAIDVN